MSSSGTSGASSVKPERDAAMAGITASKFASMAPSGGMAPAAAAIVQRSGALVAGLAS
jgi:hypothetical protein